LYDIREKYISSQIPLQAIFLYHHKIILSKVMLTKLLANLHDLGILKTIKGINLEIKMAQICMKKIRSQNLWI